MVDDVWQGPAADPFSLSSLEPVHLYGTETTEEEVIYRVELGRWAKAHAPRHPAANPKQPVNKDTLLPF